MHAVFKEKCQSFAPNLFLVYPNVRHIRRVHSFLRFLMTNYYVNFALDLTKQTKLTIFNLF